MSNSGFSFYNTTAFIGIGILGILLLDNNLVKYITATSYVLVLSAVSQEIGLLQIKPLHNIILECGSSCRGVEG